MDRKERTSECSQCGATVTVEFGTYFGGPLAYDHFAKCPTCGKEYSNQTEITRLLAAKRAREKSLEARTGGE